MTLFGQFMYTIAVNKKNKPLTSEMGCAWDFCIECP